jgi:poly-gamma-glutamate synthesis protein (capsule biosynthesis protein)
LDRRQFLARAGAAAAAAAFRGRDLAAAPIAAASLTLAATGDCIFTRPVSALKTPAFLRLVDLLRGADCLYGNCEMVLADLDGPGYPMFEGSALSVVSPPRIARELAWMGFDVMGAANNHTWDYGAPGISSTREHLTAAGIGVAGTGQDLQQAAAPAYVDTPGGRVALVNCASTFRDYAVAYPGRGDFKGIPGLNPVRLVHRFGLDPQSFAAVTRLAEQLKPLGPVGNPIGTSNPAPQVAADRVSLFGQTFVPADRASVTEQVVPEDLARITAAIADARRNARLVIVSIHAHEVQGNNDTPAAFLQPFAHACIEAGADAFFGAGSHVTWGIEWHRGRPICYGLGDFFFQYETVHGYASDVYEAYGLDPQTPDHTKASDKLPIGGPDLWQTIVPVVTYADGRAATMALHPVTLGMDEPRYQRGTPRLAEGAEAGQILDRVARLSRPYGTTIRIGDGVAEVEVPA